MQLENELVKFSQQTPQLEEYKKKHIEGLNKIKEL